MGNHRKSKKARNRSRSRSRYSDSDEPRSSRSKRSGRRRSSTGSSSSDSRRGDRYRSRSKSPNKRTKKRKRTKRSRSRSRGRDRSRYTRSRSLSSGRDYKGSRKSRSRSRQRSRSSSRNRRKRASRSRSRGSDKHQRGSGKSKDSSRTSSPSTVKINESHTKEKLNKTNDQPAQTIKEKMQKALEAAAFADAQLREQGVLTSMKKNEMPTYKEELERQKKLARIEKDSFTMQPFQSTSTTKQTPTMNYQPLQGISRDLNHDSAIFSAAPITNLQTTARYLDSITKKNGKLASDLLSASKEEKDERWFQKLRMIRRQRLEGKPIHIGNSHPSAGRTDNNSR